MCAFLINFINDISAFKSTFWWCYIEIGCNKVSYYLMRILNLHCIDASEFVNFYGLHSMFYLYMRADIFGLLLSVMFFSVQEPFCFNFYTVLIHLSYGEWKQYLHTVFLFLNKEYWLLFWNIILSFGCDCIKYINQFE